MQWFEVLAVGIWPVFIGFSFALFRPAHLDIRTNSLSQLGDQGRIGVVFNTLLVSVALFQVVFLSRYLETAHSVLKVTLAFLLSTTVCGLLTGLISEHRHTKLHRWIAVVGFLCASVGWIAFGWALMGRHFALALSIWCWALSSTWICIKHTDRQRFLLPAFYESLVFIGAMLTNFTLIVWYPG